MCYPDRRGVSGPYPDRRGVNGLTLTEGVHVLP